MMSIQVSTIAKILAQVNISGRKYDKILDLIEKELDELQHEVVFGSDISEQEHYDSISTLGDNMPEWNAGPNM